MVGILTDPSYADSIWCKRFLGSLQEQLRKNRIPFYEISGIVPAGTQTVFLIAADYEWIRGTIVGLNENGIVPVLICNHLEPLESCRYSSVSSDITGSVETLLREIRETGKKRIAVYGVNPDSISDAGKVDVLLAGKRPEDLELLIFRNEKSLRDCFAEFQNCGQEIEAVICTNDFAAISLVRHLQTASPSRLETLMICSLTDSGLSGYYREYITSVSMDYEQYGRAAVFLHKSREKHDFISTINLTIPWRVGGEGANGTEVRVLPTASEKETAFYRDRELKEMMMVEKLLGICDETDEIILNGFLEGCSQEEIIRRSYLSENAVKYRIRRLVRSCGAEDKNAMLALVKQYTKRED